MKLKRSHFDEESLKSLAADQKTKHVLGFSVPFSNKFCSGHIFGIPYFILPDGEIDGPGRAPKIRPLVLPSHRLNKNSDDRGVALEVARSSVSE